MRFLFGILLMIGGFCGAAVSVMSNIVVNSSLHMFDGLELSLILTLFSILVFFGGLYNLVATE